MADATAQPAPERVTLTADERNALTDALRQSPNAAYLRLPGPVDIAPTFGPYLAAAAERIIAERQRVAPEPEVPVALIERCLRLRNGDGTHKVPAEARNIIRAAMDEHLRIRPGLQGGDSCPG